MGKGKKKGGAAGGKGGSGAGAGAGAGAGSGKKETGLAVSAKKATDFSNWYVQVIRKSELISKYDISGCYILRPWSFRIWEQIQSFFDGEIKEMGVEPCYFPMFVKKKHLEREKDHVEGFAAEVAWVTESGSTPLPEPIAIRPTSETIMYPAFKHWIQSHRDLPLRLNQWTNVVRWEFKNPTPFLRTREFLWQEGHTAFATQAEADKEVLDILDLYARVYEELLAVPVIKGRKSEKEKFAGGRFTTTIEGFIPSNGRAIQAATSHSLGQNFSKMFDIKFDVDKHVWQNSWGLTTRTIGVMIMVHGDDQGLVLPPRVAPLQVVIVIVYSAKDSKEIVDEVLRRATSIEAELKAAGVRVKFDNRDLYTSGWKFNHWETKGVPLRLELGPRDLASNSVLSARRDTKVKAPIAFDDITTTVPELLTQIQWDMLTRARAERDAQLRVITEWDDFLPALNDRCIVLAPWCEMLSCEEDVKKRTQDSAEEEKVEDDPEEVDAEGEGPRGLTGAAKSLCIPMEQADMPADQCCFQCGSKATVWALWGRSY